MNEAERPPRAQPSVEPPTVAIDGGGTRCPYCHEGVEVERDTWTVCAGCLARHHSGCWGEHGRCASCDQSTPLTLGQPKKHLPPLPETAAQQLDMGAAYREARTLFTSGGLGYQATGALSMLIGSASSLLLGGLMNAGMWTLSLRKLRGEDEVGFGELFAHSSKFLPLLLASLATVGLTLLGLPLLVVGMFFLSGGFAYTLPLIAERDMGVKEALQTSWRLARSGGLAKHALLAFLTALPGLALMVPALGFVVYGLLTPYVFGVWAAAYRQVTGELKPENAIRLGGMQAAKGGPKQDLAEKDSPPAKGDDAAD